jgi:hypothetical protein
MNRFSLTREALQKGQVNKLILLLKLGAVYKDDIIYFKYLMETNTPVKHPVYITARKVLEAL